MNIAERVGGAPTDALMIVHCLGPLRLDAGRAREIRFRTRKARAVLAVLALHGKPMSRNALADLLWSDRGPAQARASLRQTIFELQHLVPRGAPVVATSRDEVSTGRNAVVTDLELIRTASAVGDWPRLLTLLEASDPGLLTDLDGLDPELDDWLRLQRAHEPGKTFSAAIEGATRCAAEAGPRRALELVAEILRLDPVNEEATRLAMRLSAEAGDQVAVHRHFRGLRDRLREDYQAEPSSDTVELLRRLGNANPDSRGANQPRPAQALLAETEGKPRRAEWTVPMAGTALVAALIVFVLGAFFFMSPGASPPASPPGGVLVAVLPFEQQPPDGSFLAAGLWEQTRGALTRNRSIKVLGRTTTEAMATQKLAPDGYLRRFGVTHLLEGTVRRSGAELLVSVSLTRTSDGVAVWQDAFRGRVGEPFALQDAIANGIEGKLRAQLAPGGGRKAEQIATSPEVYALYSQARQLIASRERTGFGRAEALMREAVKLDPNYAPAWSLLGAATYFNGRIAIVDSDARAEGIRDVQHALSLAPNFAPAHATLALIQGEQSQTAEASLRRAVALDPSYSEAWNWLGNSLNSQGRLSEAIAAYERAIEIDPLLYPAVINLFNTASDAGDKAAVGRLLRTITNAGASAELIDSLKAEQAYRAGDFSGSLKLLSARGLDGEGHPKRLMWSNWFDSLTAIGLYADLHRVTGCPQWYAPLVSGRVLPPQTFEGKPVTPEEFWTSQFFSAPAARAMVRLGKSRELVSLYRQAYRNSDDFVLQTDRRDMLPELATNLAIALRSTGSGEEASYLLAATSDRLERALKQSRARDSLARLARVRGAQGNHDQAVALLDAALARGWFPNGRDTALDLAQEPVFDRLRGDPRFETIRKRILDHVARERAELGPLQV
jgi:DNA-binding SARP family transcriptional activator/TolB-like protein